MFTTFKRKNLIRKNPVRTVCFSFITIILVGTFLLMLPISSNKGENATFLDCLFTATSSTCVTGFTTKDTFTQWSDFGKTVILILIQTGGLGLITFSSIFLLILNNKLSLKNMKLASSQINVKNFADIKTLFKNLLLITFICEFVGAFVLSFSFCREFGSYGIFVAIFSSVGSYCNAGLDINGMIYPNCSFIPFNKDYLVIITMSLLTFLGGIGFVVVNEIINLKKSKIKLQNLSINSKIAIFGSLFLVLFGTIGFFLLEYNVSLKEHNIVDKLFNSFFVSTAARTSGFTTVNFSSITNITKLFLCILMFIGANPTGTAGGIKISTIIIILSTVSYVIKNKRENSIFNHKINQQTTYKAVALFFLSLTLILIGGYLMWENDSSVGLSNVFFSVTSAFSTTGFQAIDSNLFSDFSKYVLIFLMYIGRIGPISFALIFKLKAKSSKQILLPEADLYV